jgi:hypothetical protein
VSNKELETGSNDHFFFKGIDIRHNHMCLSNHAILSDKLYNQIVNKEPLDLTFGFLTRLLKKEYYTDQEFCNRELDLSALEHRKKMLTSNSNFSDNWFRRIAM